jgi:hypothetical protein
LPGINSNLREMDDTMPNDSQGRCGTRLLKNLRVLQERAPELVDPKKAAKAGTDVLSPNQLRVADDPKRLSSIGASDAQKKAVASARLEQRPVKQVGGMFNGTVHVVDLAFRVASLGETIFRFSSADIQQVIEYLTLASVPISQYVAQYGPHSITISPIPLVAQVDVPTNKYTNGWVKNWANTIAKDAGIPSTDCLVILNHPSMTNTDAVSQDFDGYHDHDQCIYTFSLVRTTGLTLNDSAFSYAVPLSHEIAEMTADPHDGGGNPEICDDCANNCGHLTLNCFTSPSTWVGSVTDAVINFPYDFFISAVTQPDYIGKCPAPSQVCGYWPEIWTPLGGNELTQLGAATDSNGNLELFGLGSGGAIYHLIQNAGGWGGWTSLLGQQLREFAVANNDDGRIELLAVGGDRSIYHIWQTPPNNDWGQWVGMGGSNFEDVFALLDENRKLVAFALDTAGAVWTNSQDVANGVWGAWQPLQGNALSQVTAAVNGNQLVLCALGGDGEAYFRIRSAAGVWTAWGGIPGAKLSQIALANNPPAGIVLFGLATDKSAMVSNQPAGSSNWSGWTAVGGSGLKSVAAAPNANGLLELLSIGGNNRAYHIRQQGAPGPWGNWAGLGATMKLEFTELVPILKSNGELEALGLTSGTVFHVSQTSQNGGWS